MNTVKFYLPLVSLILCLTFSGRVEGQNRPTAKGILFYTETAYDQDSQAKATVYTAIDRATSGYRVQLMNGESLKLSLRQYRHTVEVP